MTEREGAVESELILRAPCPECESWNYLEPAPYDGYDGPDAEVIKCWHCEERFRIDGSDGSTKKVPCILGMEKIEED